MNTTDKDAYLDGNEAAKAEMIKMYWAAFDNQYTGNNRLAKHAMATFKEAARLLGATKEDFLQPADICAGLKK